MSGRKSHHHCGQPLVASGDTEDSLPVGQASNQAAKLVRSEMRRRAREQEAYAMQNMPTESDPDWKQIAPLLDTALNKLAEADRAVILLRYFEKKTAKTILSKLHEKSKIVQRTFFARMIFYGGTFPARSIGLLRALGTSTFLR